MSKVFCELEMLLLAFSLLDISCSPSAIKLICWPWSPCDTVPTCTCILAQPLPVYGRQDPWFLTPLVRFPPLLANPISTHLFLFIMDLPWLATMLGTIHCIVSLASVYISIINFHVFILPCNNVFSFWICIISLERLWKFFRGGILAALPTTRVMKSIKRNSLCRSTL